MKEKYIKESQACEEWPAVHDGAYSKVAALAVEVV
jgi:hypothetical protein